MVREKVQLFVPAEQFVDWDSRLRLGEIPRFLEMSKVATSSFGSFI